MNSKKRINNKVETYKLSPEHLEFSKKFKLIKKLRELLGGESYKLSQQMQNLKGAMTMLDESAQNLEIPNSILRDIQGQDQYQTDIEV
jgi:hypothetical protein